MEAVRPVLSRQVAALVDLQLLTAARGGELVGLRPIDLDTTGDVWVARPADHKGAWRNKARAIYFGPEAQRILAPFLAGRGTHDYLFSPAEAEAERRAKLHAERNTPLSCGNRPGSNRREQPAKQPGRRYTSNSYRRAIEYACKKQGVPVWTPHRLRHTAATRIRKRFGLEAAQIMLGHAWADVTQVYAEVDEAKAVEVARKIG